MRRAVFFLTILLLAGGCRPEPSDEAAFAVHNGRLWDGSGGPVLSEGVVVIRDGRILAAGASSQVEIPRGARRIDAQSGFILPGVIDNHVHLNLLMEREKDPLTPWLRAGVTTLVDTGSPKGGVARLRQRAAAASKTAPRLFVSGPIFTAPGGYPAPRSEPAAAALAQGVATPAEAEARIDRLLGEEGADLVKVAVETGFF